MRRDTAMEGCLRATQQLEDSLFELGREPPDYVKKHSILRSKVKSLGPWFLILARHAEEYPHDVMKTVEEINTSLDKVMGVAIAERTELTLFNEFTKILMSINKALTDYLEREGAWNASFAPRSSEKNSSFLADRVYSFLKWIELKARACLSKCKEKIL